MLVFAANWEKIGIISVFAYAAFQGLIFVGKMKPSSGNSEKIIQSRTSSDGMVTAEIKQVIIEDSSPLVDTSRHYYSCWVKRTYQDGVYIDEEELDSLAAAKSWLEDVYNRELEKHLQKTSVPDK